MFVGVGSLRLTLRNFHHVGGLSEPSSCSGREVYLSSGRCCSIDTILIGRCGLSWYRNGYEQLVEPVDLGSVPSTVSVCRVVY